MSTWTWRRYRCGSISDRLQAPHRKAGHKPGLFCSASPTRCGTPSLWERLQPRSTPHKVRKDRIERDTDCRAPLPQSPHANKWRDDMLRNLFALVGVAVVGAKAAEWYVRFQELEEENAHLRCKADERGGSC